MDTWMTDEQSESRSSKSSEKFVIKTDNLNRALNSDVNNDRLDNTLVTLEIDKFDIDVVHTVKEAYMYLKQIIGEKEIK